MTVWMFSLVLASLFGALAISDGVVLAQSTVSSNSSQQVQSSQRPDRVDLSWHPPDHYFVNNLSSALNSKGTYGFIFNTSKTPRKIPYKTYNWCNMPHVRTSEYIRAPRDLSLKYVEVIHRHHKRTPYAANCFPVEIQKWSCDSAKLFYFGAQPSGEGSAETYWDVANAAFVNPFKSSGFPGNCAFPQETDEALDDSYQHGVDLYEVYGKMLGLIERSSPGDGTVLFRATNNVITSQVAGALIKGMFGAARTLSLLVQSSDIDSLEPSYACPQADELYAKYGVGSSNPKWLAHLQQSQALFSRLDGVSGVDSSDSDWHKSYDHYFDNLSARLCHKFALPCNAENSRMCISKADAEEVFRLGQYEYSFVYRDGGSDALAASVASFGVWIAELSKHLKDVRGGTGGNVRYRHNIAHDGSISRLLSILQVSQMVWPGMGAEVVFELYQSRAQQWYVRVLWGGQVLESSNPSLGLLDMIPLRVLLEYLDGLVSVGAQEIPSKCGRTTSP